MMVTKRRFSALLTAILVAAAAIHAFSADKRPGYTGWFWAREIDAVTGVVRFVFITDAMRPNRDFYHKLEIVYFEADGHWTWGVLRYDQNARQEGEEVTYRLGKEVPITETFRYASDQYLCLDVDDMSTFLKYPVISLQLDDGIWQFDMSGLKATLLMAGLQP
ncbi:MAG TPA: hypothetical protein VMF68_13365 [Spirochaetia bacterium]|nr:hypothetical protein [Spirochaetia bacterium]